MGGQRKGGLLFFFLSFYYPRVTRKENAEPQSKSCNGRGGEGIYVPREGPEVPLWVSPSSLDMPDGEINLHALGGGAGTDPSGSGTEHEPPGVTGLRATSAPRSCGTEFIFHAAPVSLSPLPS